MLPFPRVPLYLLLSTHIHLLAAHFWLQWSCNLLLDEHNIVLLEAIFHKLWPKVVHLNHVIKHHHRCMFMLEKRRREGEKWELAPSNPVKYGSFHLTPPTFHFLSGLISRMKWPSNMWENGPWPGKQERQQYNSKHQGPELPSSNIIDTGTSAHPGHGRVLQSSHRVHPSRWSPALAAYAARSPPTLQLGSQHCSRKTPQVICHFYKRFANFHLKNTKSSLLSRKVFIIEMSDLGLWW